MADNKHSAPLSPASSAADLELFAELIDAAKPAPLTPSVTPVKISDEIARERKLKNDDAEQDIRLKKQTLNRLFWFLAVETIVIFAFTFLQGTHRFGFHLEEWSFKLLTSVTIAQITVMLFVAVNYLFPKSRR